MRASIQVGKIIGIPIRLHISFLFILFLIVLGFATNPAMEYRIPLGLGGIEISPFLRYFLATLAAILFFFAILLHEMAHSYVAMRYGTTIHSITLFFFGGLAMMGDIPNNPEKEWRIAIAGPIMSLAIGSLFLLIYFGMTTFNFAYRPVEILVFILGYFNVIIAMFNLLPAFPMDGGRVLRALLAKRMSFLKATKKAVLIGKIFAVMMVILGIFADPFTFILTGEWGRNLWLPLLAIFLYMAATEEERATTTFAMLEGIKVKNVMRTEHACVLDDIPIMELSDKMLAEKTYEYAVVGAGGEPKGFVTFGAIKALSNEQRYIFNVSDVIGSFDSVTDVISEEEEAVEALKRMLKAKKNVLAVVEAASGNFNGVIT